jgi:hypothetical protein
MRDLTGRTDQTEHAARRQNMAVAAMAVTAIVAIVTVVVGPWRGGGDMSGSEGAGNPESVAAAPPPEVDTSRPHLIVSPAALPAGGGDVALILANPGAEQVSFSVTGTLERWESNAWANHRQVTAGLNAERPAGKLVSLDEDLVVPMVYIGVEPGGFSRPRWTHVEAIEPGWYRFSFGTASGLFQVGPPSTPLTRPTTAFAFDSEGVRPAGTVGALRLSVIPRKRLQGAFDEEKLVGRYISEPLVERLDSAQGSAGAEEAVTIETEDGDGVAGPFSLRLPALEPGVYRISRESSIAGRIESLFWVAPLG